MQVIKTPPILVTGRSGQLGHHVIEQLGDKCAPLTRDEVDLTDPSSVLPSLEGREALALINTAAYTAVDSAETDQESANAVNGESVGKLAEWAFARGIPFIHFSTDYVFDGSGDMPWKEDDKTAPLSVYGKSKRLGELAIKAAASRYPDAKWMVFRTSWVYDAEGQNFLNTILNLAKDKEELSIVNDQMGAPTYALDLALLTIIALRKAMAMKVFPTGVYHLTNAGEASWYDFAEAFIQLERDHQKLSVKHLHPVASDAFPRPAERPKNSRLCLQKFIDTFLEHPPHWQDALKRCMAQRQNSKSSHMSKTA